jgi:D-3-phosphoglycerate dehydrogenase
MIAEPKILVTCPPMLGMIESFAPDFANHGLRFTAAQVTQTMTEEELIGLLPAYDGWIIGDDPASARVLEAGASGKLRAIVKWGVGVDNVDFDAADRLQLKSANTPGVFGKEVADLAMNYVSGLARHSFRIDREIRANGSWPKPAGISLAGKNVGLIGYGDIGQSTAKRLRAAEMNLSVYDPFYRSVDGIEATPLSWPEGIGKQDFLVFTAPLNPQTHHMLDRKIAKLLKHGVRIINVGRGPLIEDAALIEGLKGGHIHSVALDVFEQEPLPGDSLLREYPDNIFGSHNASNTVDAVARVSRQTIAMISDMLANG